jgi:chemotaxis protein CheZ
MPERRKVFRVEKMAAPHGEIPSAGNSASSCCEEVMRELAALRAMLAAAPLRTSATSAAESAEMARLTSRLRDVRGVLVGAEQADAGNGTAAAPLRRFTHELEAAVKTSEQATQRILAAAEEIDQAANNLSAAVKGNSEQGLAQDIRDRVIAIFEACNFQDVTSQRLAKVKTALAGMEQRSAPSSVNLRATDHRPSELRRSRVKTGTLRRARWIRCLPLAFARRPWRASVAVRKSA